MIINRKYMLNTFFKLPIFENKNYYEYVFCIKRKKIIMLNRMMADSSSPTFNIFHFYFTSF